MKLKRSPLKNTSPFGPNSDRTQIFTPREIVSGFIEIPPKANPLESAWHASAIALDTERVRVVQCVADGGIYFIAADAGDFVNHPDAITQLAAALPCNPGHKGDGAYFVDVSRGIIAVVIKSEKMLRCYVGEHTETTCFAEGFLHYWPSDEEAQSWVGYRQYESYHARKLTQKIVLVGMLAATVLVATSLGLTAAANMLTRRHANSLNAIRDAQQSTLSLLNTKSPDAYREYRELSTKLLNIGGTLIKFESKDGKSNWDAEVPAVVADISNLGADTKIKITDGRVTVSKFSGEIK